MIDVSVVRCDDYTPAAVGAALDAVLAPLDGLAWVKEGMTVGIKANLVHASRPEKAAVTHPVVLAELTRRLVARGATVIVGDSPGGLYNAAALHNVYRVCGMQAVEEAGGKLNQNFSQETVEFAEGMVLKSFPYTSWLRDVDAVIDVCKLKTHGMMGFSGAAKNLFGVIPGTSKPEYHYRYPNHADFARLMIDLNDYVKPTLAICDAVVGMEGNGPTGGTPRQIGCLLASFSTHKLDLAAASIIGLGRCDVPTLVAAHERGYIPDSVDDLVIEGDLKSFYISDYQNVAINESLLFSAGGHRGIKRLMWAVAEKVLITRPDVHKDLCIGCGKCKELCPAKTITIEKKKAKIHKKACIRCFCCQEFCPVSAIKVKRTALARLASKM